MLPPEKLQTEIPQPDITPSSTQRTSSRNSQQKEQNTKRKPSRSGKQNAVEDSQRLSREISRQSSKRQPRWWKIRIFKGMIDDVKRRAPYYWSDWKDAWDYRVVPATIYMYFAKYVKNKITIHCLLQFPERASTRHPLVHRSPSITNVMSLNRRAAASISRQDNKD